MNDNETQLQEEKLRAQSRAKKRKAKIKRFLLLVLFVAIVAVIVWFAVFKEAKKKDTTTSAAVQTSSKVIKDVYTVNIDLSGSVAAYDTQSSSFRTTGPVVGVYVKEGDSVKKGEKIASIDATSYEIALIKAQNELKRAQLNGSEIDIKLAQMTVENAKNNLTYTDLTANFDGVIASLNVHEGDYYEAGKTTVVTVVDVSKLKATVEIDEIDMRYVELGQKVKLSFDSLPGQVVEGYVSYIPMLGEYSNQGIGIVKVELTIDNPPKALRPGYSFEGIISVEGDVEMLLIPQSAVTTARGGVTTVQKKNADGTLSTETVGVKYLGEGYAQLVSGNVKEGDTLVYNRSESDGGQGFSMSAPGRGGF